ASSNVVAPFTNHWFVVVYAVNDRDAVAFKVSVTMRPYCHKRSAARALDAKRGAIRIIIDDGNRSWLFHDRIVCFDNRPRADLSFAGDCWRSKQGGGYDEEDRFHSWGTWTVSARA